ncbi:pfs domain-containing protein [Colletotrichum higginsianum]|uniref:Pfs domain-containing protein n=1 Tax=Colletotrichum higginsianum (strain IMI 349063) TaxID=759273 RepID=H1V1Q4_COLHI|nr:Pfs domain-containing protein [Colletotrichum higginsianum IMI 349063]OBR04146.1 Pfs domain-containing protein [Colletotrichum higginsianum IMI 349063]CCF34156.1 pfs domain-containing protein [Colletotrichum higginsianum]
MARVGHLESQMSIKLSTHAVLFLGTPHQGGQGVSIAEIVTKLMATFTYTNKRLIEQIKPNSEWLQDFQSRYNAISQEFKTVFFYETKPMSVPVLGYLLIVPRSSAVVFGATNAEEVALAADHSTMAKFTSLQDRNFRKVGDRIVLLFRSAGLATRGNWARWEVEKTYQLDSHTVKSTGKTSREFNVGVTIAGGWNDHFTGRQKTLLHLDDILRPVSNRSALKIVVIYGPGGVGKTQVALEYANRHQGDFASIFWIDGNRKDTVDTSIRKFLEDITNHYRSHDLVESPRYKLLSDTIESLNKKRNPAKDSPSTSPPPELVAKDAFFKWLSFEENRSWLLIIDNMDDLESVKLRDLLPTTTWGTILVTSRRADLAVNWESIQLLEMEHDDAFSLLEECSGLTLVHETAGKRPRRKTTRLFRV